MSGVDVLAVLDELVADMGDTPGTTGHQVAQAAMAVAELIEAATDAQGAFLPVGNAVAPHARLTAAIFRCRGGAR